MIFTDFVELRLKPSSALKIKWAKQGDILTVVWCDYRSHRLAVANMTKALGLNSDGNMQKPVKNEPKKSDGGKSGQVQSISYELMKPKVFSFSEAEQMFDIVKLDAGVKHFVYPKLIREPERVLDTQKWEVWSKKRDIALSKLGDLITPEAIERYLLCNGHQELIDRQMAKLREQYPEKKLSSANTLIRYLNQYVTFGMRPNALLPRGLINTGCNYQHNTNKVILKRGRGGADGRNTKSINTGVRPIDKRIIKKISKMFGASKRNGALFFSEMYDEYCLEVLSRQKIAIPEPDNEGKRDLTKLHPYMLSNGQFKYHYENLLPLIEKLTIRYGVIATARDHTDRQGHAADGALGANHIVEIDSTELSVHVRDTRFGEKRLSAGRLFLCIAICVRTRYILGYSLSFKKPTWENVAECLYNALEDKQAYCKRYGISLRPYEWVCHHAFEIIRIDNGNEFPESMLDGQLRHSSGFFRVETVQKGRGDFKAVVERQFGTVDRYAASLPGGIEADRDKTEQDASQRALLSINDIHRAVIRAIIHQNTRKNCAKLRDKDMAEARIGITPYSLWTYSIEKQMGGGRPIPSSQLPSYRYSLLPKCEVTIKENGVHFCGLVFNAKYASDNDWYLKAKYGVADVTKQMAYIPSICNALFYEDDQRNIHTFELVEQCDQYRDFSWEQLSEYRTYINELQYENRNQQLADRLAIKVGNRKDQELAEHDTKGVPRNDQTSYQTGTTDRRNELAAVESRERDQRAHEELSNVNQTKYQDEETVL